MEQVCLVFWSRITAQQSGSSQSVAPSPSLSILSVHFSYVFSGIGASGAASGSSGRRSLLHAARAQILVITKILFECVIYMFPLFVSTIKDCNTLHIHDGY